MYTKVPFLYKSSEFVFTMAVLRSLLDLPPSRFETPTILRLLASASRALAELKGVATRIPREEILINTLSMQEAKDSSEIENINPALVSILTVEPRLPA